MIYTYYDKIYNVPGIGRAPPGLPGLKAPRPGTRLYQNRPKRLACWEHYLLLRCKDMVSILAHWNRDVSGDTIGQLIRGLHNSAVA
jgi:hypothetical protein